jgi:hypothetical protein
MRALLVVILLAPALAHAQEAPVIPRRLTFAERGASLVVSGSFTDVFDAPLLEGLSSGYTTTVVIRSYVYRLGTDPPVHVTAATVRIVYDLWDEVYLIQIRDAQGERNHREPSRAEALRRATQLVEFPVAPLSKVAINRTHFVALLVEVNPVSEELLAEVRRWMSRPGEVAGNSSFFGSFVSVFVNPRIAQADRTLRLQSQEFFRVPR